MSIKKKIKNLEERIESDKVFLKKLADQEDMAIHIMHGVTGEIIARMNEIKVLKEKQS